MVADGRHRTHANETETETVPSIVDGGARPRWSAPAVFLPLAAWVGCGIPSLVDGLVGASRRAGSWLRAALVWAGRDMTSVVSLLDFAALTTADSVGFVRIHQYILQRVRLALPNVTGTPVDQFISDAPGELTPIWLYSDRSRINAIG